MTATTAQPKTQIGNSTWYLTGISRQRGTCDHCGRALMRLFHVVNPGGEEMTLGSGHVKAATGWSLSWQQAENALRSARRITEVDRRESVVAAEFPVHAAAYAELEKECRQAQAEGYDPLAGYHRVPEATRRLAGLFQTASTEDSLWLGGEEWREYLSS